MVNYELMLILDPSISEEERNTSLNNLKTLLKDVKAEVKNEDLWGEKKLAYKINKSERGFYALYDLDLDGKNIKDLSKSLNLDKKIWRYMFTKKDV